MRGFFPKLRDLERIRKKILKGDEVKFGVFCSGNGDRSPLIQQVLQEEFKRQGLHNVRVFSFGVSTSPTSHHQGAAARTREYAVSHGYTGIDDHKRRHVGDEDVQKDIREADLLLAVSPSHLAMVAEYGADEHPEAAAQMIRKTWTLKGLANRREWTLPFDGLARMFVRMYRGLATKDPYFQPKTPQGDARFRQMLDEAVIDAKKAAKRLFP